MPRLRPAHGERATTVRLNLPAACCNGEGFWSYGLESFLRRHRAEGLSSRLLAPEELFHPSALETHKI